MSTGLANPTRASGGVQVYAKRLFKYLRNGQLAHKGADEFSRFRTEEWAASLIQQPVAVLSSPSRQYPYFIQELGRNLSEVALGTTFTSEDAETAGAVGLRRPGFDPFSGDRGSERDCMNVMANDGEIANRPGLKSLAWELTK